MASKLLAVIVLLVLANVTLQAPVETHEKNESSNEESGKDKFTIAEATGCEECDIETVVAIFGYKDDSPPVATSTEADTDNKEVKLPEEVKEKENVGDEEEKEKPEDSKKVIKRSIRPDNVNSDLLASADADRFEAGESNFVGHRFRYLPTFMG